MKIRTERKNDDKSHVLKVFDIVEFSTHDGPGIRTAIFFQGCNSQCDWCHSPHSQSDCSPLLFNPNICVKCKRCEEYCPTHAHSFQDGKHIINRKRCNQCGICIDKCPNSIRGVKGSALLFPTVEVTARSLFEQIEPFVKLHPKSSGITLSGGEALLQLDAAKEFLQLCKAKGYNIAIETSGLLPLKTYQQVMYWVDIWLFGTRIITAKNNVRNDEHIDRILHYLTSAKVIPLIPMVPSYYDREEIMQSIASILKKYSLMTVCFTPWNKDYDAYYRQSGIPLKMERPSDNEIKECETKIKSYFLNLNFKEYENTTI